MTTDKILALKDERIGKAVMQPSSSILAQNLFGLMHSSINSCFVTAGMDGRVIAIDQDKMERMAERRNVDLARYEIPLRKFMGAYLKQINKKD